MMKEYNITSNHEVLRRAKKAISKSLFISEPKSFLKPKSVKGLM
jgi:hypothetical protein